MFFFIIPSGESYCNDRSKEFSEKIFMRGGPSIMATTRIMPLHVGKGRTESRAISDIIDYVANEVQPLCLHPLGKGRAEAGEYPYR